MYHGRHIAEIECLVVGFLREKTVGRTADVSAVKAIALVLFIGDLHGFGKQGVDDELVFALHSIACLAGCFIERESHP